MRIRGPVGRALCGALLACGSIALAGTAQAQGSYSPYNESASDALARYVRALTENQQDFDSLIGAGRASAALGDAQAAAGFFARADEVQPRSPHPQAGMGSVAVLNGQPHAALPYFARALQLGATPSAIALDRGLAYDLLGRQAEAQADYRLAMTGRDAEEARRRLALSLAISGKRADALALLGPLMAKGDAAAARSRAFVLALTGDPTGARIAVEGAMPGSWSNVEPFVRRLATLQSGDKAAAVNLGIFPDQGSSALAMAGVSSVPANRIAGIEQLYGSTTTQVQAPLAAPAPKPVVQTTPPAVRYASAQPAKRAPVQPAAERSEKRLWLQLASAADAQQMSEQFRRMKSRNRQLFDGISPFVANSGSQKRLVIGPFRGRNDAEIFAEDLQSVGIEAASWTNSTSDQIVPLGTE